MSSVSIVPAANNMVSMSFCLLVLVHLDFSELLEMMTMMVVQVGYDLVVLTPILLVRVGLMMDKLKLVMLMMMLVLLEVHH